MLNVVIAGVGGQGSVLAAKVLAQAAADKGWQVRSAETIGMAQRGGNVASHVRMGNAGEQIASSLVPQGQAHCVIALEPGEGLRSVPFLAPDGLLVSATTGVASVTASLSKGGYDPAAALDALQHVALHFVAVDDAVICRQAGSAKVLNVALLAAAIFESNARGCGMGYALSVDNLKDALQACVKPEYVAVNLAAVDAAVRA